MSDIYILIIFDIMVVSFWTPDARGQWKNLLLNVPDIPHIWGKIKDVHSNFTQCVGGDMDALAPLGAHMCVLGSQYTCKNPIKKQNTLMKPQLISPNS